MHILIGSPDKKDIDMIHEEVKEENTMINNNIEENFFNLNMNE